MFLFGQGGRRAEQEDAWDAYENFNYKIARILRFQRRCNRFLMWTIPIAIVLLIFGISIKFIW